MTTKNLARSKRVARPAALRHRTGGSIGAATLWWRRHNETAGKRAENPDGSITGTITDTRATATS